MADAAQAQDPARGDRARRVWTQEGWQLRLEDALASLIFPAVGTYVGWWWVPFVIGLAAGVLWARRVRWAVTTAAVAAAIGWLLPIWALALRGQPVGATARAIAGLAGLPPYAGVTLAVLALLAALQVWVGAWLAGAVGRVVTRRR